MKKFEVGDRVNWKGQPERLIYMGCNWSGNGYWNQFALVSNPDVVWCETPEREGLDSFEYSERTTIVISLEAHDAEMRRKVREFLKEKEVEPEPIGYDYHYEFPKQKAQWKREQNRFRGRK